MMNIDWNWFYSSLSQSAAAIVGIFGAFIITKIFSNQTAFAEKNGRIKQYLIQAKKIAEDADSHKMKWYNKHYNDPEYGKFSDYLEENFPASESNEVITEEIIDDFISSNRFSKYSEKHEIRDELLFIAKKFCANNLAVREREEAANEAEDAYRKNPLVKFLGAADTISGMRNYNDLLNPKKRQNYTSYDAIEFTDWKAVHKESESLERSYLEAKHHGRLVADLLKSTEGNPESPRQISAALALVLFIFFVGVIYPLSFMPASGAPEIGFSIDTILSYVISFKGMLLGVIGAAFTTIVTVFYLTNSRMKYNPSDLTELDKLTDVKNYCNYFKFILNKEP